MSNGVTPREVVSITLHDSNLQTIDSVGIQATVGGTIDVINHNGDTVAVPIGDGQIIPLNIKDTVLKTTGSATGIVAYV